MLAAGWGSPIPSAHFLSRDRRPAPMLACFALQRPDGDDRHGPDCLRVHDARPKNCPLVANSLLVNAQAFDIRITSPSPSSADRAPSDAEPNDKTHEPRSPGSPGSPTAVSATSVGYGTCADGLALANAFPGFQAFGWDAVIRGTAQTDVTRPYFPGKQPIFPSQAPAVPPQPTLRAWGLQCCHGAAAPDLGTMQQSRFISRLFTDPAMQRCVRMVCCSTPPLLPSRCCFYWPRQLPTTQKMPAPDERAAELVQATSQ